MHGALVTYGNRNGKTPRRPELRLTPAHVARRSQLAASSGRVLMCRLGSTLAAVCVLAMG
jgi:hypothetical protein